MDRPTGTGGDGDAVTDFLAHYGVKGMRWGHRKADSGSSGPTGVTVSTTAKGRLKITGGTGHAPVRDAVDAAVAVRKAKASSVKSLTNEELQTAIRRMQLEQQFNQLRPKGPVEHGRKFVTQTMLQIGKEQTTKIARDTASAQIAELLKKQ
jgi:hypothetical protein